MNQEFSRPAEKSPHRKGHWPLRLNQRFNENPVNRNTAEQIQPAGRLSPMADYLILFLMLTGAVALVAWISAQILQLFG